MISDNFHILFIAAIIPLLIGALWYHDKVFGKAWLSHAGLQRTDLERGNMLVIFGLCYILSLFIALFLTGVVIHQSGLLQLLATHPDFATEGSEVRQTFDAMMASYGDANRTARHVALHGGFLDLIFVLPVIASVSMFER